jgi:alpha-beta hydrolase superfamily lysophospholipase
MLSRAAAIVLCAALAACAGGASDLRPPVIGALTDAPMPTPDGANQTETNPPQTLTLTNALPVAHWPAAQLRAVIIGLHGYGDYGASTFARAARAWSARGIATYAPDQRGFGRASGWQRWPGADALIADAGVVFAAVQARHPGVPMFMAGHSMGGAVVLAAAGEGLLPGAAGLILLAPAVWGGDALGPHYRAAAWLAALATPDTRWTGGGIVRIHPSDNRDMLIALSHDPLHYAAPSGREFLGLVRLMDRAVAAAPDAPGPALVVLGAHEEVVDPASVRALPARLQGPTQFAYVPEGWHMLLRDRNASRVHDLTADWALARAAATKENSAR